MRQSSAWAVMAACLLDRTAAHFDYAAFASQDYLQTGDGTFYGQQGDQDSRGACSFSENGARSMNMSWTMGAALSLAINKEQFDNGKACGMCVMYKGIGGGIGVTPISSTQWYMGFVNNICPECSRGDLDQDINGDGRWRIQWYAVPCNVGTSGMRYDLVVKAYDWISIVVSNTRIPVSAVSVKINGKWMDLQRSVTNQWPYHRENGDWKGNFPMPIRVTSILNETLEDYIQSADGSEGTSQFAAIPGPHYVSAEVPGRGVRPDNAFTISNPGSALANIGPIKGANEYGVPGWGKSGSAVQQMPSTATSTTTNGNLYTAQTVIVDDGQQCGGTSGECTARDRGQPVKPCIPGVWPLAICRSAGSSCQSVQGEARFECKPSPLGNAAASTGAEAAPPLSPVLAPSTWLPSPGSSPQGASPMASLSSTSSSSSSWSSQSPGQGLSSPPPPPMGSSPARTGAASGGRRLRLSLQAI